MLMRIHNSKAFAVLRPIVLVKKQRDFLKVLALSYLLNSALLPVALSVVTPPNAIVICDDSTLDKISWAALLAALHAKVHSIVTYHNRRQAIWQPLLSWYLRPLTRSRQPFASLEFAHCADISTLLSLTHQDSPITGPRMSITRITRSVSRPRSDPGPSLPGALTLFS